MQTIPLAYIVLEDLKLFTGPAIRSAGRLSVKPEVRINAVQKLKTGAERGKVLAVDIEGMNRGKFNASLMEFAKVPGNELWLVEPVYDDVDVLDAFIGYADKLVFPYHCVRNDSVLKDIYDVSDNCVPLLVCECGKCFGKDPLALLRMLSRIGFHNIMVADMDGSITDDVWKDLLSECGGLITYSPARTVGTDVHILAEDLFQIELS